jgi:EpsI family protein
MIRRIFVVVAILAAVFATRSALGSPPPVTTAEPLSAFPLSIGAWKGRDLPLAADVLRVAAVDDYLNRSYSDANSGLGLYVGYYQRHRQGEALHSPLFCLPGSGWQPVETTEHQLRVQGDVTYPINELIVERGLDRMLVLYWYQTLYRVTGSEYRRKLFLMADALSTRRTDVALVRITAPVQHRDRASERQARELVRPFAAAVLPELQHRLFR